MRYRNFGNTGWSVSTLALGTAELCGAHYGLYEPVETQGPTRQQGVALLLHAFERGINLLETSPSYGESEGIVGLALREWSEPVFVATQVDVEDAAVARQSIADSLRRLGREQLDVVQLHDAGADDLQGETMAVLVEALQQGTVARLGAAVYSVDAALAALRHEEIAMVQVAFNLLDQRAAGEVFAEAEATNTALLASSPLLKGVLTDRRNQLPPHLASLRAAADRAERWAGKHGDDLRQGALRFCLSQDELGSVLVGVRTLAELAAALETAAAPTLPRHQLSDAAPLALADEQLVDPRSWDMP